MGSNSATTKQKARARKKMMDEVLGMPLGTANARLKKSITFMLARISGLTRCYRCSADITSIDEFTIEHKKGWLRSGDPKRYFFDLDNIAFSHLICNVGAACKPTKKYSSRQEMQKAINARRHRSGQDHNAEARRNKYLRTGT